MRKKILFFTFLVFVMLMITPYTSSISISDEQQNFILKSKEYVDLNNENTTAYLFMTLGPRDSTISKITYQNGTFLNASSFWLNLMFTIGLRLGFLVAPLTRPIGFMVLDKIDFTVEYIQDMPQDSRGLYYSYIVEMVNGNLTNNTINITNEKHTVKLEGFHGALVLLKRSMLFPTSFEIVGECDHYTLIK
ncbi:MAG: hypothetical protein MUO82_08450 [Candidatus Thermoplasmatota archaeon]|nr:hypothetical protein [Candidatus Thermoplasmatota archaeon]